MSDFPFGLTSHQVGLGLRREMLSAVLEQQQASIDFFEVAPENWLP